MDPIQKLYIEASTLCNLDCKMCMRRTWQGEPMGHMDMDVYRKVIDEAAGMDSIHTVFFGGIGEPMFHPQFVEMVRLAKAAGKRVEAVSNGTLINQETAVEMIEAGLDEVWISVDGFDEAMYNEIRVYGDFNHVKTNILYLLKLREMPQYAHFDVGLTFVAMKDNVHQLLDLMKFAWRVGASDVKVTNILPYSAENVEQALYWRTLKEGAFDERKSVQKTGFPRSCHVDFPIMDIRPDTVGALSHMLGTGNTFSIMGQPLSRKIGYCRFVQEGNVFVRWDGEVTQCMALLHPSVTYMHGRQRNLLPKSFGSVRTQTLQQVWEDEAYVAFREKVKKFDFSYCVQCGGCHRLESNQEDCFGNEHPTCGACLWAQGFIQCP